MRSVILHTLAGLAAIALGASAQAADMPSYGQPMPQPMIVPVAQEFSGWYLRGDVGVGMTKIKSFDYIHNPAGPANDFAIEYWSMGDTAFAGGGIGYEYNNWLRFDATFEYRNKASVYAFGRYTDGSNGVWGDSYNGQLKTWLVMANAYADLGTWWCFTPFIGFGVGGAYHTFSLADTSNGTPTGGFGRGWSPDTSDWKFAWALHAGVAYNISRSFKVEVAYRYLNMGSMEAAVNCVGGCAPDSYRLKDISSHDIKVGLRWVCCEEERQPVVYTPAPNYVPPPPQVYAAPPVYAQPAPQYVPPPPPPTYQQPLMRKG
jgi:opacity protein-like surface antigen